MYKFKINDNVQITAGKDKGQQGKIIKIFPKQHQVLVENKNTYKKHFKAQGNQPGKIVTLSRPLPAGNIALICPQCKKPTRVGFEGTGTSKVRICRKCHQIIKLETKKK